MARIIKGLIPSDPINEYKLNPMLKSIASEEQIMNGILAFKEFLSTLYDHLIIDGDLYEKPSKQLKKDDLSHDDVVSLAVGYPFIV